MKDNLLVGILLIISTYVRVIAIVKSDKQVNITKAVIDMRAICTTKYFSPHFDYIELLRLKC